MAMYVNVVSVSVKEKGMICLALCNGCRGRGAEGTGTHNWNQGHDLDPPTFTDLYLGTAKFTPLARPALLCKAQTFT